MKTGLKWVVLIFFLISNIQIFGQFMLQDIKMEQIRQKKVRKYIGQIGVEKHLFSEIHPSCFSGQDMSSFSKNEMTFFLDGSLEDIWRGYMSASPSESWNGRKVSFGVLLQKFPNSIFYNRDPMTGVATGQVYFLNLKVMKGIYNLPVAFEIITVDTTQRLIEFSYIEGNKSSGVQQIQFFDAGQEHTKVMHISYFKSDSDFRDKWIYPPFHKKIVNDFHRNMRKLLDIKTVKI
jgi:hypothetical protein